LAAVAFGIITLAWHDFNTWQQIRALGNVPHREILVYVAAAAEIFGGLAIQWTRTARIGALVLGSLYLIFALLWVPHILAEPHVYDRWGNFFEQFSLVSGAMIVYGWPGERDSGRATQAARIGYICFGICVVSFTLEQLIYLSGTASFVPKWIPPGQMLWAIVTTIALALAAIAMLFRSSGRALTYRDAPRFWAAGMAARAIRRSAQNHQLGRQRAEFGDNGSGVDCGGFLSQTRSTSMAS
jgi:uncharacterized membrane protein YphA (DoxX/SURF4 family)